MSATQCWEGPKAHGQRLDLTGTAGANVDIGWMEANNKWRSLLGRRGQTTTSHEPMKASSALSHTRREEGHLATNGGPVSGVRSWVDLDNVRTRTRTCTV